MFERVGLRGGGCEQVLTTTSQADAKYNEKNDKYEEGLDNA